MRVALYGRVSTKDQTTENQFQDLRRYAEARGWEVAGEFEDVGVSGRRESRPGLDAMMTEARARRIGAVVVAGFDRFGRSLGHLVRSLEEFQALGVAFVSVREAVDLTTPTGRLMFALISAMAEFERSLIVERVHAGLRRAKAQGKRLGRRPRVFRIDKARELRAAGWSLGMIARELGVSRGTVSAALSNKPCADGVEDPPGNGASSRK